MQTPVDRSSLKVKLKGDVSDVTVSKGILGAESRQSPGSGPRGQNEHEQNRTTLEEPEIRLRAVLMV